MRPEHKVRLRLLGFNVGAVRAFEKIYGPNANWGSDQDWEAYILKLEANPQFLQEHLDHWNLDWLQRHE